MKIQSFQQEIVGTSACMKIIIRGKKVCGKLLSDNKLFADIGFSGVKTDEWSISQGVDYCGLINMGHKLFCLSIFEKLMKDWLGGSHIVMKSTPIVPGDRPLMAIR